MPHSPGLVAYQRALASGASAMGAALYALDVERRYAPHAIRKERVRHGTATPASADIAVELEAADRARARILHAVDLGYGNTRALDPIDEIRLRLRYLRRFGEQR